jgi:hypothetical protein
MYKVSIETFLLEQGKLGCYVLDKCKETYRIEASDQYVAAEQAMCLFRRAYELRPEYNLSLSVSKEG